MRSLLSVGLVATAVSLAACGGGGSDSPEVMTGTLNYPIPVSGLNYLSDNNAGVTDENGSFKYWKGGHILFGIGDITIAPFAMTAPRLPIGSLTGSAAYLTNERSLNVLSFLLAVDDDANPENGIQVSERVREAAKGLAVNFDLRVDEFRRSEQVTAVVAKLSQNTTAGQRPLKALEEVKTVWDRVLIAPFAGDWQIQFDNLAASGLLAVSSSLSPASLSVDRFDGGRSNYVGNVGLDGAVSFSCADQALLEPAGTGRCLDLLGQLGINDVAAGDWREPTTGSSGKWQAVRVPAR